MKLDVIVIGGSAGALEPLLEIVSLPIVVPIVIAFHLAPNVPSLIPGLLAHSGARAFEAEDKLPLAPATAIVAPPNYHILLERDGRVALSVDEPVHFSRPSIDVLFESAAAYGSRAGGVLLSGASEDGALGLARLHAAGGLAIVQDPATAAYPTMPAAALVRVPAARVLTPPAIGALLRGAHPGKDHAS